MRFHLVHLNTVVMLLSLLQLLSSSSSVFKPCFICSPYTYVIGLYVVVKHLDERIDLNYYFSARI